MGKLGLRLAPAREAVNPIRLHPVVNPVQRFRLAYPDAIARLNAFMSARPISFRVDDPDVNAVVADGQAHAVTPHALVSILTSPDVFLNGAHYWSPAREA